MHRFKTFRNTQGVYRVQIQINGIFRWLMDEDLLMAIVSSHRSKILHFESEAAAQKAIADYLAKEQFLQAVSRPRPESKAVVEEDFQEVSPGTFWAKLKTLFTGTRS